MHALILGGLAVLMTGTGGRDVADAELLAMGRDRWIQKHLDANPTDYDALRNAEKRFSLALALRKEKQIKLSPNAKTLDNLDILMANITKGACRLADYQFEGKPDFLLINSKAEAVMVLTMNAVVNQRPSLDRFSQADVWRTYTETQRFHEGNRASIKKHAQSGGYPVENYFLNYSGLGKTIEDTMTTLRPFPDAAKRHVFGALVKLIRLTRGEDPLPYPR